MQVQDGSSTQIIKKLNEKGYEFEAYNRIKKRMNKLNEWNKKLI
ncbi:hypothetical protein B4080_3765 [Bacillus cereus]|nr:hypothetical protein B4080_3765 [Bacillus cereus]